ncbi:MAG: pyridoxamine 5'-phosphate oxidase family protein [Actinomycetota bacterium]|nr:pyridoxamine 5'-phosphate oxidase family protein [Actinomycetota bacterium]
MTSPAASDPDTPDPILGRRLASEELRALLDLALPAVFSTVASGGWVHSVPVHFVVVEGEIRIVAERGSVKEGNVLRTGRATLCVVATVDAERCYVTVEGPTRIEDGIAQQDLDALDRRYGLESAAADDEGYAESITLVLRPDRWIGWADRD